MSELTFKIDPETQPLNEATFRRAMEAVRSDRGMRGYPLLAPAPPTESPQPGFSPRALGLPNECMRLALACCMGIEPIQMNWIAPTKTTYREWFGAWVREAHRHGWCLRECFPMLSGDERGFWIAVVPLLAAQRRRGSTNAHAVVMKNRALHYDPARTKRTRRPTKFLNAYTVEPFDG